MALRFLVDESTGYIVAHQMREAGYDAVAVVDVLPRASDREILAFAVQENRIVVTNDKDFGDLIFSVQQEHCGVMPLRSEDHRPLARWQLLEQAIQQYGSRLSGSFTVITKDGIRIRNFRSSS